MRAETRRTRLLLLPMSQLCHDLLQRAFSSAPDVEVHTFEGDTDNVRRAIAALEPDWIILELGRDGLTHDVLRLFDARPRVKVLGLAEHGARSLLCVQLGELSPPALLHALESIDRSGVLDVAG